MKKVLMIDDEPAIIDVFEYELSKAGFSVQTAETLQEGRAQLARLSPDILILDLNLPDGDGLEFCRELRGHSELPVLMLTCRDDDIDRILGLEHGADDYVLKSVNPREVVARVRSILRRTRVSAPPTAESHRLGVVVMKVQEHRIEFRGAQVGLTPTEFAILGVLIAQPQRVFSREQLVEQIHDARVHLSSRTIDSHIKGIRRRFHAMEAGADPVETVYGVGYRARSLT